MRERRTVLGRVSGLADDLAAAARRRQLADDPRVTLYDVAGRPRLLDPDHPEHARIVEVARRALVDADRGRAT